MNTLRILTMCLITTIGFAQNKEVKMSQSARVNKDVVVALNTNYVEIEIDTWNKDEIQVEAYLESDELSQAELKKALESWNLKVDATTDKVVVSSNGGNTPRFFSTDNYDMFLQDLEFELADLPKMPEMPPMPVMPNMAKLPEMPEMPEMPKFPELPELPEGVNNIEFDYEKYQDLGKEYLTEWSKQYEKQGGKDLQKSMEEWAKKFAESGYEEKMKKWGETYGKRFEGKWAKDMEKWGEDFGEKFGKDMEKWGADFGERFGKEWEAKMEAWGERFGEKMEKQSKAHEKRAKAMEEHSKAMEQRAEAMAKRSEKLQKHKEQLLAEREKRKEEFFERRDNLRNRNSNTATWITDFDNGYNKKVRRIIKIKMPKKAKLKLNVRHGELKMASAIHDAKGNVSHANVFAQNIDGSDTSINVAYSKVLVNHWKNGTLSLNYVEEALLENVKSLTLNANSSNINIDNLSGNNIIDGSFGELSINNIMDTFSNLNIVLENSDAWVKLPNVDYSLMFKGERSRLNNEVTKTKSINGNSGKTIVINAKYSNITTN